MICHLLKFSCIHAQIDRHITNNRNNIDIRQSFADNVKLLFKTQYNERLNILEDLVIQEKQPSSIGYRSP